MLIRASPLQDVKVVEVNMAGRNFTLAEDGGVILDGRVINNYCIAFNSVSEDGSFLEEPSIRHGYNSPVFLSHMIGAIHVSSLKL